MNKNMIKALITGALAVSMAFVFVGCKGNDEPAPDTTVTRPAKMSPSPTPGMTPSTTPAMPPAGKMGGTK